MDAENIKLVQSSFERILPRTDQVAELFFRRLSELDPMLRTGADRHLPYQRRVLMAVLLVVVQRLHRLDQLLPFVQDAGIGRVSQAEIEEHYLTVGAALLWALEQGLGAHFTLAVRLAWLEAYTTVVAMLQEAADAVPAPRASIISAR